MSDQELVALVHVVGTPDATGAPGLLIDPSLVVVPSPPVARWAGGALEVVLAPKHLGDDSHVERTRVAQVHAYPRGATGADVTSLIAVLEHPSAHPHTDLGDEPADSTLADHDGDVWRALVDLGRVPAQPPQPSVTFLRRLPAVETRKRPRWESPFGDDTTSARWWPPTIFRGLA